MSSLSAAQADGYYIPPQYLDSGAYKKKSVSQFNNGNGNGNGNGKGTKGGHNQYLQRSVVRFELPYDGFCKNESCKAHVGKGTRFNAHKSHVDEYHSTKIWEFTMKCRACAVHKFVIRTNPKGRCFDYVTGLHRKVEEFDTAEAGTLGVIDTHRGNSIIQQQQETVISSLWHPDNTAINNDNDNLLKKLETRITGKRQAITERDAMQLLINHSNNTMRDDASSNSNLRETYRNVRNAKRTRLRSAQHIGLGNGIELHDEYTMVMTPEKESQSQRAFTRAGCGIKDNDSRKKEMQKFASIRSASIFSNAANDRHLRHKYIPLTNHPRTKSQIGRRNSKLCTRDGVLFSDDDVRQNKMTTQEVHVKQKGIEQESSTTNVIKGDRSAAILSKENTSSKSHGCHISSLLVLGEYDSDSP